MNYYELNDDINYPNRWYLGDILGVDNWDLLKFSSDQLSDTEIELFKDGDEMDFTFTEAYGIPVVSQKVKEKLNECNELAFIHLNVLNKACKTQYYAMITKKTVECVDESASEFQKFEENDPVRPDKAGDYRAFMELRLDAKKIVDIDVFRLSKFETAVIISEKVKQNLEAIDATGLNLSLVV